MNLYDLGKEPISAEQPAGRDISYDDEYEKLSAEIKKLSSPTADSVINWSTVIKLSQKLLAEDSKNIQVACYLAVALCHTEGLQGCTTGIHILRELVENFWDSLYPPKKRKKGRINALLWWNDKLRDFLEDAETESWDLEKRDQVIDDVKALDDFIGSNLPDGPILRPLVETLSALLTEKQANQEAPPETGQEAPQQTQPDTAPSQPATDPKAPVSSLADAAIPASAAAHDALDATAYFTSGNDYLAQAASRFFVQDYTLPVSYQLNRILAWSQIDAVPPASDGKTMLPPPDEQVVALLQNQYDSGLWSALLSSAEGHIHQYLFWLDLSFWVATALENLRAESAALAVANDTLLYLDRLKSLKTLCFSNGIPFACDAAKEWLENIAHPVEGGVVTVSGTRGDPSTEYQTTALQILKDKGLPEALRYFQENSASPQNDRERFVSDLSFCQLMLKGKNAELSRPFAQRLLHTVDTMHLESWDPELAVTALFTAYRSLKLTAHKDQKQQLATLRDRMILLAPQKALGLI